ncbi:MAG: DUF4224 domain-containing protein [Pseudomonadota bacterium]
MHSLTRHELVYLTGCYTQQQQRQFLDRLGVRYLDNGGGTVLVDLETIGELATRTSAAQLHLALLDGDSA